jgi:drug/metabolite transporter (DMT)-like permease
MVAALSVPFLGEKFGWRRWSAIAVGFFGVIIIIRPSMEIFSGGSFFALIGALLFSIYLILTRYVSREDGAITSFFWMGMGGTVTMSVVSFFTWEGISQEYWMWLLLMCIISAISHFLMVKTLQLAEASVIQPFSYLQLVFASFIGVIFFSETIHEMILIGTFIVITAGLFTFWREYKIKLIKK